MTLTTIPWCANWPFVVKSSIVGVFLFLLIQYVYGVTVFVGYKSWGDILARLAYDDRYVLDVNGSDTRQLFDRARWSRNDAVLKVIEHSEQTTLCPLIPPNLIRIISVTLRIISVTLRIISVTLRIISVALRIISVMRRLIHYKSI
ncbi:hypothetical protein LSAT2_031131 [Lamellibrachia satsuma]|nr:hypothetical protein LSAT2_031131 [Lamellibrachia satsuma]